MQIQQGGFPLRGSRLLMMDKNLFTHEFNPYLPERNGPWQNTTSGFEEKVLDLVFVYSFKSAYFHRTRYNWSTTAGPEIWREPALLDVKVIQHRSKEGGISENPISIL